MAAFAIPFFSIRCPRCYGSGVEGINQDLTTERVLSFLDAGQPICRCPAGQDWLRQLDLPAEELSDKALQQHLDRRKWLRLHPEHCERCRGTGEFAYRGRVVRCGCPRGEDAAVIQELVEGA